ncbi:MAG: mannitol dehydrogenase family protein [Actinomycetota bacterium]
MSAGSLLGLAVRGVEVPAYDVASAPSPTLVHFGPGVFHRAHQAVYADTVLGTGSVSGAICAVSLRSRELRDALSRQDHLYSLISRSNAGDRVRIIGSIRSSLVAPEDPEAVLRRLTDPAVTVVTITVTEKGYCAVGSTGDLDTSRSEVAHDIACPSAPLSLLGFLVEGLARRRTAGVAPFTVASCDNLRSNGVATRRLVLALAACRSSSLSDWIAGNVAFPSSMVDRMAPASTEVARALLSSSFGYDDAEPVVTEPFSQWVLEDSFPSGRPPWELAGVEMVASVEPFEQAKLRILNGAHSAFAYFGLLSGHAEIASAAADPVLRALVMCLLETEVIPTLEAPAGMDLAAYAGQVVSCFENRALGYTAAKVAGDGSQKLGVRILAAVRDRLAAGAGAEMLAAVVAAYAVCVLGPRAAELQVQDPALDRLLGGVREPAPDSEKAVDRLLGVAEIFGDLTHEPAFSEAVRKHAAALWDRDPREVLTATGER